MRVEVGVTPGWEHYRIYDIFDGKEIRDVIIADEEKREVKTYLRDNHGKLMTRGDSLVVITRKCWVKIVKCDSQNLNLNF